jgi:NTE family protein
MAIPSVFTAIDYKDTKLVDGGVVRNFPVRDVKDMGADHTIGVNLSQGLLKADQLHTAVDVLYQIAFYKDADDFQAERRLCNILIEPPMDDYSAASFSSADELISLGKEWGNKFYPTFKKLADSLKNTYPEYHFKKKRLPKHMKVTIDGIRINGLKNTSESSFIKRLNLDPGTAYDGVEVATAIRKVYGSRNYNRIAYHWEPTTEGRATLVFDVIENPQLYLKLGLHYHTFSNVAVITTLAGKNLLWDRSKSLMKLNISENFRMLLQQNQTFGKQDNNNLILSVYHERFKFPIYNNFEQTYLYRSFYTSFDLRLQHTFSQHSALGVGTAYEDFALRPRYTGAVDVKAGNNYWQTYLYYDLTTVNQKHFSTSGWKISVHIGQIYHQRPDDVLYEIGEDSGIIDTLSFNNYGQLRINIEKFKPLNEKWSLLSQLNTGMNLKEGQSFLNFFNVGGLSDFLRNQITFAGLNEYQLNTNSIATFMLGLQYNPYNNLYTTVRANVGLYDFAYAIPEAFDTGKFLSGYSFTVGYSSALGPIQISAMYNDQSSNFSGYVNIGFHF